MVDDVKNKAQSSDHVDGRKNQWTCTLQKLYFHWTLITGGCQCIVLSGWEHCSVVRSFVLSTNHVRRRKRIRSPQKNVTKQWVLTNKEMALRVHNFSVRNFCYTSTLSSAKQQREMVRSRFYGGRKHTTRRWLVLSLSEFECRAHEFSSGKVQAHYVHWMNYNNREVIERTRL